MRIGYACLALGLPGSEMKNCRLQNADRDRLLALIGHNLTALERLIDYNITQGVQLFRISSDLIPFGSSVAENIGWQAVYSERLAILGEKIRQSGMRVSMHPGQYTVLNSPDRSVVERAVKDLAYHADVLDHLGLDATHKLILHLGGGYGNKADATMRFRLVYRELPAEVKRRLVLENDDRIYTISEVLAIGETEHIPVVFDNLHHQVNQTDEVLPDGAWIRRCGLTWTSADGPQKIHYSQQHRTKRPGAHSDTIDIPAFLTFVQTLPSPAIDIMLEVKDKNVSALKCINCTQNRGIQALEQEWARYKYLVLERSRPHYDAIRQLLKDKSAFSAREMYRLIDEALGRVPSRGNAVNAAMHVWGYFKHQATASEKRQFEKMLALFESGTSGLVPVKRMLERLAVRYEVDYLLHSYYFMQAEDGHDL